MNRDEIIKMAESCGIPEYENNESQADNIVSFFYLVQAAERESCAKVVEDYLSVGLAKEMSRIIRDRGNQ